MMAKYQMIYYTPKALADVADITVMIYADNKAQALNILYITRNISAYRVRSVKTISKTGDGTYGIEPASNGETINE